MRVSRAPWTHLEVGLVASGVDGLEDVVEQQHALTVSEFTGKPGGHLSFHGALPHGGSLR